MTDLLDQFAQNFHFLRPLWLIGLLPAVLLFLLIWIKKGNDSSWEKAIDPELLAHLLQKTGEKPSRSPLSLVLVAWIITLLALAGPVWQKIPQPVHEREDAMIILFDLSLSMYAEDVKPNRLIRARRKLFDLLKQRQEGLTGLVVYAGDAHTVSPLTDDANTIAAMIPAITPDLMPVKGSRLTPAIGIAMQLFHDAGITSGHLLIITDEIRDIAAASEAIEPYSRRFPLSVLSVGSEDGGPIPLKSLGADAVYLKDNRGVLVIPKVDIEQLRAFASMNNGRFSSIRLNDDDLEYLLEEDRLMLSETFREMERDFDIWHEEGPWLILILLPIALLAFRRGWLWVCLLFVSLNLAPVNSAQASLWDDLWETRDQQAQKALSAGRPAEAAELFENPDWKASAYYKGEKYTEAAALFSQQHNAQENIADQEKSDRLYNLGNTLAKQGSFEDAIKAYDEVLKSDPAHEDAAFNKKLVEDLLKDKENQDQDKDSDDQDKKDKKDQQQNSDDNSDNKDSQQGDSSEDQSKDDAEQQDSQQQEGQQDKTDQEKEEQAEQQNKKADAEDDENEQSDQEKKTAEQMAEQDEQPMDSEEKQALQQWLQRVPDDPGGLLRKKFRIQYNERRRKGQQNREDPNAKW